MQADGARRSTRLLLLESNLSARIRIDQDPATSLCCPPMSKPQVLHPLVFAQLFGRWMLAPRNPRALCTLPCGVTEPPRLLRIVTGATGRETTRPRPATNRQTTLIQNPATLPPPPPGPPPPTTHPQNALIKKPPPPPPPPEGPSHPSGLAQTRGYVRRLCAGARPRRLLSRDAA